VGLVPEYRFYFYVIKGESGIATLKVLLDCSIRIAIQFNELDCDRQSNVKINKKSDFATAWQQLWFN